MSRLFFDVTDSDGLHRDAFGESLTGIQEAREQCRSLLPEIAREELPDGELRKVTCDARDETGRVIY